MLNYTGRQKNEFFSLCKNGNYVGVSFLNLNMAFELHQNVPFSRENSFIITKNSEGLNILNCNRY